MKKFKKLAKASVAMAAATVMAVGAPLVDATRALHTYADSDYNNSNVSATVSGDAFEVVGVPSSAKVNNVVSIPKISKVYNDSFVNQTDEEFVTVISPSDKEVSLVETAEAYTFVPTQVGRYVVKYAVKSGDDVYTVSKNYVIKVTQDKYSFEFTSNNSIVLPATVDTKSDASNKTYLPLPAVYTKTELVSKVLVGKVGDNYVVATFDNDKGSYTYSAQATMPDDVDYALVLGVKVAEKTYTNDFNNTVDTQLSFDSTKNAFYFNAEDGKNIITYRVVSVSNYSLALYEETKTIEGSRSYDSSKAKLGFTVSDAPTSASLNDKTYFPLASAYDKNNANVSVDVYTRVKVEYVNGKDDNGDYIYVGKYFDDTTTDVSQYLEIGKDTDGIYFVPKKEGDYYVTYNVVDFYGNTGNDYGYSITGVNDSTAPEMNLTKSFDISDISSADTTDYTYVIPTKYSIKTTGEGDDVQYATIVLPAIYAVDSVDEYANLSFIRRISSSDFVSNNSGTVYVQSGSSTTTSTYVSFKNTADDASGTNSIYEDFYVFGNKFYWGANAGDKANNEMTTAEAAPYKATQEAIVTLDTNKFAAGTYTVYYQVSDKEGNKQTWSTSVSLVNEVSNTSVPTIEFDTTTVTTLTEDKDVSIKVPTVKDTNDSNLFVKYYAYFSAVNNYSLADEVTRNIPAQYVELTPDEDGNLTFSPDDVAVTIDGYKVTFYQLASASGSMRVAAYAWNDFADYTVDVTNQFTLDTATYKEDLNEKNIGVSVRTFYTKNTNDLEAPSYKGFSKTDLTANNYDSTVEYSVTLASVKYTYDGNKFVAQNGTELNNGVYEWEKGSNVVSLAGSELVVDMLYKQYGSVYADGVKFYDNSADVTISVKIQDSEGNYITNYNTLGELTKVAQGSGYLYTFPGVSFTAGKSTSYTVTYSAVDAGNNIAVFSYVLKQTEDAEAPKLSGVNAKYTMQLGTSLSLGELYATDNNTSNEDLLDNITCSSKSGNEYIVKKSNGVFLFEPQKLGTYTLEFTVTDDAGFTDTATTTIIVRDTTAPTLNINGAYSTQVISDPAITNDNYSKVYLNNYSVSDDEDSVFTFELEELKAYGTLKVVGPVNTYTVDGTDAKDTLYFDADRNQYYFTPTAKGTYKATYSASDYSGNKASDVVVTIYVGDTVLPIVQYTDTFADVISSEFKVNDTLTINPATVLDEEDHKTSTGTHITVTDNNSAKSTYDPDNDETTYNNFDVTVSVVDSNGNVVSYDENKYESDGVYTYTFTTAGTYTVTVSATDAAGNVGTKVSTIKVVAETTTKVDSTEIIGAVVIVASLAILAGVVIYFVKGSGKGGKKTKKVEKTSEENN